MKTIEELKNSIVDINYIIENMIRKNGLYCTQRTDRSSGNQRYDEQPPAQHPENDQ